MTKQKRLTRVNCAFVFAPECQHHDEDGTGVFVWRYFNNWRIFGVRNGCWYGRFSFKVRLVTLPKSCLPMIHLRMGIDGWFFGLFVLCLNDCFFPSVWCTHVTACGNNLIMCNDHEYTTYTSNCSSVHCRGSCAQRLQRCFILRTQPSCRC